MKISQLTATVLLLTLMACNLDRTSRSKLLVKEIEDPGQFKEYFTYIDGKLATYKRIVREREQSSTVFYYTDNKLVSVREKLDMGTEFITEVTYNEKGQRIMQKLTRLDDGEPSPMRTSTFSYKGEELVSIKSIQAIPGPVEVREFHWDYGNITRIDIHFYENESLSQTITRLYEYDDNLNFSNQDIAFIYARNSWDETMLSRNNQVSMQELVGEQSSPNNLYSFSYNDNGYPVSYAYEFAGLKFAPTLIKYY